MASNTVTQTPGDADSARVVQFSDTHISHRDGVPEPLLSLLARLDEDPPDLLIVSGDIVFEDPDDDADREFGHAVLTGAPCPVVAIPGNHDIGFYGEDDDRERRIKAVLRPVGQRPVRPRRGRVAARRRQRLPARHG